MPSVLTACDFIELYGQNAETEVALIADEYRMAGDTERLVYFESVLAEVRERLHPAQTARLV